MKKVKLDTVLGTVRESDMGDIVGTGYFYLKGDPDYPVTLD